MIYGDGPDGGSAYYIKAFPHTRGVILPHISSTSFQKGSDPHAVNT